ncbi:hypothetical protein [Plantactinospora sp. GCM10030261]|uniref:hypothetical protein n=1 Tax=Plantactinospora sp. GCM10030261 TaxID=3273420 RepID=UPI00360F5886
MSLPAFTAEAALRPTATRYVAGGATGTAGRRSAGDIVPQNIACDIEIRCIDGIRYMTTDCPDGSGDTIRLGPCGGTSQGSAAWWMRRSRRWRWR